MPANIKTTSIKPLNQEAYLRNGSVRKLPIYKTFITQNWEKEGHLQLLISRQHVTGNVTGALFAIDRWCKGVSSSFYFFNEPEEFITTTLNKYASTKQLTECTYTLAHNVIFNAKEFASGLGLKPDASFNLTACILEPDTDKIEFIDIECGKNGRVVLSTKVLDANAMATLKLLEKKLGKGNFDLIIGSDQTVARYKPEQINTGREGDFLSWSSEQWNGFIENGSLEELQANMELPAFIYHRVILLPEAAAKKINLDLLREQLSWGLTTKPVQANPDYLYAISEEKEVQALHSLVYSRTTIDKGLFTRIKTAISNYPDNPIFMNYQFNALIASGKKSEAEAFIPTIIQRFPDYLFGKIALAHLYKQQNLIRQIPLAFENHVDLHSLYPDRTQFHASECVNFYSLMCLYYLEIKENLMAEVYATVIREWLVSPAPEFTTDILGLCDVNMLKQVALRLAQASESIKTQETFVDMLLSKQ